jgi:hypothetical protein
MTEETLFTTALAKPTPAERAAFLDEACAGDTGLRRRVETLLASHAAAGFLETPAVRLAAEDLAVEDPLAAGGEAHPTRTGPPPAADDEPLDFLDPSDESGSLGRLAHYEVREVVGRGGMGVVLRAFDERLHRVVAIKVMAPRLATSATARRRFTREARAAAAVTHDHIVTIHAVEESGPLPYIVMQFVAGASLQDRLDRTGPLQLHEVLRIGMQTAAGLAAAHAQGLVHRDVKPSNILLENGVERVKLTDFGLARAADDASLTQSGVIAGTPSFMSPEQAEGRPVDQRSDLFSLGSVLYAMCTGRPPFRAGTSMGVLKRVCEETPTPVREVNAEVPDWLAAAIEKLHAKDPAGRFQTAAEVADLLGRHLAHVQHPSVVPLPATPSALSPLGKRVGREAEKPARPRRPWAAAAAVLAAVFAALGTAEATGVTNVRATVTRVLTPDGTLVVETDDPNVKVTVEGDGGLVITGGGLQEIRLRPGSYRVLADRDGRRVPLDRELVTVSRGGRAVVRVKLEPPPPPVAPDSALTGSFTVSVKGPGGKGPVTQKCTINERIAGQGPGADSVRRAYPWGTLEVEVGPAAGEKLALKRLRVDVTVREELVTLTTVSSDLIEPRRQPGVTLTAASAPVLLYFDESAGLDGAEITVTGSLTVDLPGKPGAAASERGAFVLIAAGAERKFDTLSEAVLTAAEGDTIEVRGNGPFVMEPIHIQQALTIRAGEGFRPALRIAPGRPGDDYLFTTHSPLVLEGLDIREVSQRRSQPALVGRSVIYAGASLRVANCGVWQEEPVLEPVTLILGFSDVILRNCHFRVKTHIAGLGNDSPLRCVIDNCLGVGGALTYLHCAHAGNEALIEFRRCSFSASQLAGVGFSVAPDPPRGMAGEKRVRFEASDNVFDMRVGMFQFEVLGQFVEKAKWQKAGDAEAVFMPLVGWSEKRNAYSPSAAAIWWSPRPGDFRPIAPGSLKDWRRRWNLTDTGSSEGAVRYHGGDLRSKAVTAPEKLTPEDFRLRPDSAGYRAGPSGKDLGADVDLVGPGPAYERWKKTPEYQQWLKDSGQLKK